MSLKGLPLCDPRLEQVVSVPGGAAVADGCSTPAASAEVIESAGAGNKEATDAEEPGEGEEEGGEEEAPNPDVEVEPSPVKVPDID